MNVGFRSADPALLWSPPVAVVDRAKAKNIAGFVHGEDAAAHIGIQDRGLFERLHRPRIDPREFEIGMVGMRAMDSMRIEKSYRMWGLDLSPDYTPFEIGRAHV